MKLEPGTLVRSIDNPGRNGVITNTPPRVKPAGRYVQVRWSDGGLDYIHEDEIECVDNLDFQDPFSLVEQGRYGRAGDLRRNLTYVHLSGKLANLVYSMGITNTDFYPHQYRPLLALLDSPVNGLLIADEVGLGKTIEAGLIWTELRARFDMRRLLIVCPAMLREKWRDELRSRFGVDAQIVKADDLLDALKQPRQQLGEGKAWIISYQAALVPASWKAETKTKPKVPRSRWRLAEYLHENYEDEPIVDMVVFDEAHYMRNSERAAWRLGDLLRGVSDYQVMLSATPINLRNRDLFNLLRLLDPDHFRSEQDFQDLIESNKPLVAARDAVLNAKSDSKQIIEHLYQAANTPILANSFQLSAVLKNLPNDEKLAAKAYRAELADTLERINLLSHVITRTRKRDVQERRITRDVSREEVVMSDAERELYETVTRVTQKYAWDHEISDGFLLATPQRQVTSCPAAVVEAWQAGGSLENELMEDLQAEYEDELFDYEDENGIPMSLRDILSALVPRSISLDALRSEDSKFTRLLTVAGSFLKQNPTEKIVLFTSFRATARYLVQRLTQAGLPSLLLIGGQVQSKQETIDEFRANNDMRFLISTEVASEGVDLQFCRVLVNYDLPWNPTRIEQRIGRIDRLGQQASVIHIWNLYFKDTIDQRIVVRLLDRLRIFEEALGEAEAMVGEEIRRLESSLLNRQLSIEEEEKEIDRASQALENLRLQREALDRNAAHMMAHGQRVMERIEAARELSRRVTELDLYIYVKDYLNKYWPGHRFLQEGDDAMVISIHLPSDLSAKLDTFLKTESLLGKTLLASGEPRRCRFLNKISAAASRGEEIIHQFHPLIRFISRDLKARNDHFYPLIALILKSASAQWQPETYVFYVRCWRFKGVREEEILAVSVLRLRDGDVLSQDDADQLLQMARVQGEDWTGASQRVDPDLVRQRMEDAEEQLEVAYKEALLRKKNENADRTQFQLDAIDRYLNRRLPRLEETMRTQEFLGRTRIVKLTQGKIDKLTSRMDTRKKQIQENATVLADKDFICSGIIKIENP
jgi:SNF2 family DNA or RNA helicase